MLEVSNLEVNYGRIRAVRGVHLSISSGELISIVGANGAGKSSLLNAIAGVVPIKNGIVRFEGHDLNGHSPDYIVRRRLSLVPEGRQVFTRLTVEENLKLAAQTLRMNNHSALSDAYSKFPILEPLRKAQAGQLSGGEQQMLVIARALTAQPRMLMLDEPSLGLAPRLVDDVLELLGALSKSGTTILLVEQNAKALKIATRAMVMSQGSLSALDLSDPEVEKRLARAYLG